MPPLQNPFTIPGMLGQGPFAVARRPKPLPLPQFAPPLRSAQRSLPPMDEEEKSSLLSKGLGGLEYVGGAIDKPYAAMRGLVSGITGGSWGGPVENPLGSLANLIPFSDTLGITDSEDRVYGRGMLRDWGLADKNKDTWGNFAAGLALDLLIAPPVPLGPLASAMAKASGAGGKVAGTAARAASRGLRGATDDVLTRLGAAVPGASDEVVAAAKAIGGHADDVTPAQVIDDIAKGDRALAGVGLPWPLNMAYDKPLATFGRGEKAAKLADLAYYGQYSPIAAVRGLFGHNLSGIRDPKLQRARDEMVAREVNAAGALQDYLPALRAEYDELGKLYEPLKQHAKIAGDAIGETAFDDASQFIAQSKSLIEKNAHITADEVTKLFRAEGASPEVVGKIRQFAEQFANTLDDQTRLLRDTRYKHWIDYGGNGDFLDDLYAAHSPRRPSNPQLAKAHDEAMARMFPTSFSNARGRSEFLRNIPESRMTLNAIGRNHHLTKVLNETELAERGLEAGQEAVLTTAQREVLDSAIQKFQPNLEAGSSSAAVDDLLSQLETLPLDAITKEGILARLQQGRRVVDDVVEDAVKVSTEAPQEWRPLGQQQAEEAASLADEAEEIGGWFFGNDLAVDGSGASPSLARWVSHLTSNAKGGHKESLDELTQIVEELATRNPNEGEFAAQFQNYFSKTLDGGSIDDQLRQANEHIGSLRGESFAKEMSQWKAAGGAFDEVAEPVVVESLRAPKSGETTWMQEETAEWMRSGGKVNQREAYARSKALRDWGDPAGEAELHAIINAVHAIGDIEGLRRLANQGLDMIPVGESLDEVRGQMLEYASLASRRLVGVVQRKPNPAVFGVKAAEASTRQAMKEAKAATKAAPRTVPVEATTTVKEVVEDSPEVLRAMDDFAEQAADALQQKAARDAAGFPGMTKSQQTEGMVRWLERSGYDAADLAKWKPADIKQQFINDMYLGPAAKRSGLAGAEEMERLAVGGYRIARADDEAIDAVMAVREVAELVEAGDGKAGWTGQIAERLGEPSQRVAAALKQAKEAGLVTQEGKAWRVTPAGEANDLAPGLFHVVDDEAKSVASQLGSYFESLPHMPEGMYNRTFLGDQIDYMTNLEVSISNLHTLHNFVAGVTKPGEAGGGQITLLQAWNGVKSNKKTGGPLLSKQGLVTFLKNNNEAFARDAKAIADDVTMTATQQRSATNALAREVSEGLVVPEATVGKLNSYLDSMDPKSETSSTFGRIYDQFTNLFRGSATVVAPSFHMRNLLSGAYQNITGETPYTVRQIGLAYKHVFDWFRDRSRPLEYMDEIIDNGMLGEGRIWDIVGESAAIDGGGLPEGGLRWALDPLRHPLQHSKKPWDLRGVTESATGGGKQFPLFEAGDRTYKVVEAMNRIPPYIAARKAGKSPSEAKWLVDKLQYNYSNLSQFERQYVRRFVVPFYGWAKMNTLYQFENLFNFPGSKNATVIRMAAASQRATPGYTPRWLKEQMAFPLPGDDPEKQTYLRQFGLPFENLNDYSPDGRRMMERQISQMNPILGAAYSFVSQRDPYSGRDLADMDKGITGNATARMLLSKLSPTNRLYSEGKKAYDVGHAVVSPETADKGVLPALLDLMTGAKLPTYDSTAWEARDLQAAITDRIQASPYTRDFTTPYIPKRFADQVSPQTEVDFQRLQELREQIRAMNEVKKARR